MTSRRSFLIGGFGAVGAFLFRPVGARRIPPHKTTTTSQSTTTTVAGIDRYAGAAYGGRY